MHKRNFFSEAGIGIFVLAAALIMSSCASKITDDQLAQLKELRTQERSLNESISKNRDEKSRLEAELKAKKSQFKDCDDKLQFVKSKLATWPDVWPDWKPESR